MNESIFLNEIRAEAREQGHHEAVLEIRREDLSRVLRTKLSGSDLNRAISRVLLQQNPAILSRWFDLSLTLSPEALVAELDR